MYVIEAAQFVTFLISFPLTSHRWTHLNKVPYNNLVSVLPHSVTSNTHFRTYMSSVRYFTVSVTIEFVFVIVLKQSKQ